MLKRHIEDTKCVELNIIFYFFSSNILRIEGVGHNVGGHQEIYSEKL
jgi:hypothetical protein